MFGNALDQQDTNFKPGMKTKEKCIIAINMLASGENFIRGGGNW